MRSLLIVIAFSCTSVHAETDFYDISCKADNAGAADLNFEMSIASEGATITATSDKSVKVAMYENAFVWDAGDGEMLLDRMSGRLSKSNRGPDGKRSPLGPTYQCRKIGGKLI